MLNRLLTCVTCVLALGGAEWIIAPARAQYAPTGGYHVYTPDGTSPGTSQAVPPMPQRPVPTTQPQGWPGSYVEPDAYGPANSPYGGQQASYSQPPVPGAAAAAPYQSPTGMHGQYEQNGWDGQAWSPAGHGTAVPPMHGGAAPSGFAPPAVHSSGGVGGGVHPELAEARPFLGAHVVARVGNEVITVSDVMAQVPTLMDRNRGKMPDEMLDAQQEALLRDLHRAIEEAFARQENPAAQAILQSEQLRAQMLGQLLEGLIQTLLVFLDAQRNIPEEGLKEVRKQVDAGFDKQMIPDMMKRAGASSRRELDEYLRARGTSMDRERRGFFQQSIAQQWVRQHIKFNEEITHEQMLEYYRNHLEEFDRPAETVWEQLCVQFVDQPSPDAARAVIAEMGNRVIAGEPFAEVAKKMSQGPTAAEGGRRVWPEERILSEELEKAINGLPVGQLSPILRDWRGLHIVRVVERTPAGRVPFEQAQQEIRGRIREERVQKQIADYVVELKRRTSVWTVVEPVAHEELASPGVQRR